MPGRLMLLDTPSLYFRAFYGVPDSVRSPQGEPVNAVRGLLQMTAFLIERYRPDCVVAAMDHDWRPQFRVDLVPSYKLHRVATVGHGEVAEEIPDALSPQVPVITDVLTAVGIPVVGAAGYEADDVIGTLATRHDGPVDVVTGDRDLFQLVDDARGVRVLYTQKGIANIVVYDEAAISAKYGIPGRGYADYATLRGDPSDGLPGVPGVGEKTAAALITKYGDLDALLAACDSGADGLAKVVAARAYVDAARTVVAVACDVDIAPCNAPLPAAPAAPERLVELADRWGLDTPLNRLLSVLAARG
ncbi:MAG TPA: 5'-3' exonuclease H3TH domain-containing protein [Mycobacteriales bacterium]|nr:5'-3' exonuclease H3TH domain-containing protein [Mycobacteriales bacterium]